MFQTLEQRFRRLHIHTLPSLICLPPLYTSVYLTTRLCNRPDPVIGRKPVDETTTGDVLTILTPIWTTIPETASRVRQRLEAVFDWVVAQGWRPDNPAGRAVTRALPRVSRMKRRHAALPILDVPAALKMVRESGADMATRLAFEFLVLTAARSSEARLATWWEMDLQSATWKVPAERMKARREHKVPLSGRSLEILGQAGELNGHDTGLVFPAGRPGKTLSDMTLTVLLRRLGIPAVPHGFRSSF